MPHHEVHNPDLAHVTRYRHFEAHCESSLGVKSCYCPVKHHAVIKEGRMDWAEAYKLSFLRWKEDWIRLHCRQNNSYGSLRSFIVAIEVYLGKTAAQ